ncbi:MAG: signal peptidase I, partial [Planctomycetota bacterium]
MQTPDAARLSERRPWVAVLLSLVCGGLGQIYCGRIAKGLVLMLLAGGLGPALGALALVGPFGGATAAMVAVIAIPNLVWLYAVVDAYFLARKHGRDYQLKDYNRWYVYLVFLLMFIPVSITCALLVREGFFEAFSIPAGSMHPTIWKGDRVLVDKRVYRAEPVERGDVIVLINPNQRHVRYIKRVVALANDTIEMKDNVLFINGEELPRAKASDSPPAPADGEGEVYWETNGRVRYLIQLDRHAVDGP